MSAKHDKSPEVVGGRPVNALLGKGASFEGKLVFEGTVHVNGKFTGEIRSNDTLIVGEGAVVEGDIQVGTLIVNGEVSGTIKAVELVELQPPARVRASIDAPELIVARGARLDGSTRMADGADGSKSKK
jgi:cytoskeletal protein CcmA (bactofilin family)